MGAFDGIGTSVHGSSFEVALWTGTPMVLIVNARGMSMSVAALISGFVKFAGQFGGQDLIRGVILNQVGKGTCDFLKPAIEAHTGVKVLGFFERQESAALKSRHLGLVTAAEVEDLDERMNVLAKAAASSIDLNALLAIGESASVLSCREPEFMEYVKAFKRKSCRPLRLGVAMDSAFCFYYRENLELLEMLGVELVPFSPLKDSLPEGLSGLYLGGGYPELFAGELSENTEMQTAIREACDRGLPVLAECGGYMYLHEAIEDLPMVGVIPGRVHMTKKLGRFGYVFVTSAKNNVFGPENTVFRGHEFHYSKSDHEGSAFVVSKSSGRSWEEGFASPAMYGGYPHLYFYSNVPAVIEFVKKMGEYI